MVVILSQRTNARNCTKFRIFSLGKTYIKKLSSTKSDNFVEYLIKYAIGKGEVIARLNNRRKDLGTSLPQKSLNLG